MRTQSQKMLELAAQMGERLLHALEHTDLISKYTLNEFQVGSLRAVAEKLGKGYVRQFIKLPGAAGKTRIGLALIEALSEPDGTPPKTIIKSTLTAIGRFIEEAEKINSPLHTQNWMGQYHGAIKQPEKRVVLTSNDSHRLGHARNVFIPENTTLIISDEGHRQLSPAQRQLNKIYDDHSIHIAMTATDTYSAEKTLSNEFKEAYSKEAEEAIEKKIVTPVENFLVMFNEVDISKVKKRAGDLDPKEMARLLNKRSLYLLYAQLVENWKHPKTGKPILGQKIMANVGTIQEAKDVAKFFNNYFKKRLKGREEFKGLKSFACATHSANFDEENKAFDDDFRAGKHLMQVVVRSKAESYNYDKLSVTLNISATTSTLLAAQRAYRPMRPDAEDPDKTAWVFDGVYRDKKKRALTAMEALTGTAYFKMADAPGILADAFENYWELYARYEQKSPTGPRVITPDEMIVRYAQQARSKKNKDFDYMSEHFPADGALKTRKRKFKDDIVDGKIRKRMLEKDYLSIREIFNEAVAFREPNEPRLDYHRMLLTVSYVRNLPEEFRDACKVEIDVLRSKLDMPDIEKHLPKPNTILWAGGDAEDYEHKFSMDFVLPKIRQQIEKMNISTFTELFSLVQAEYPTRKLLHAAFFNTIEGTDPPISDYPPGIKRLQNLTHVSVALSRFFRMDPRELFSEDQYFEHVKKFKQEFPQRDWVIAEAFGHLTPRERSHDKYIISGEVTNVAIIIFDRAASDYRQTDVIVREPDLTPRWMKKVLPLGDPQQSEILRVLQLNPQ